MEFKKVIEKRRSVRRFTAQPVPAEVRERLTEVALTAPSSRNSRSTRLLFVDDPELLERMSAMRDFGAAFLKHCTLAVVILGDTGRSDLWRENGAITATLLQLACVDEGLASCWVHINDRPREKANPQAGTAEEYLRTFLPIPEGCRPLCALAVGYSDFTPAALPPMSREELVVGNE